MSTKIDVNGIKNVLSRDVIPAGTKGKAACKLVADYVRSQNWTGPVRFWDSDMWVNAESMTFNAEIKSHGGWNGGFDTRLGYALNGHTSDEIKAARGTGSTHAADGTSKPRASKTTAEFNLELGTVEFKLGDNADAVVYDSGSDSFSGITPVTASTYGRKLLDLLSNARESVKNAAETRGGNLVKAGYAYGGYESDKLDAIEAGKDILGKAIAKTDMNVVAHAVELMNGQLVVSTGNGIKAEWVVKYLPEPEPEPAPVVSVPSEIPADPQTVVMAGDGGPDTTKRGKLTK